jgi:hypothetical protein
VVTTEQRELTAQLEWIRAHCKEIELGTAALQNLHRLSQDSEVVDERTSA